MTPEELEKRRMKAMRRFEKEMPQAEIARELGVTKVAVHYWHRAWKENGKEALYKKKSGPEGQVGEKEKAKIERALLKGPEAAGYATDLWTLARIRKLIKEKTGVAYGQTQVWRLIRTMGYSYQKPMRRAKERDEEAIAYWKRVTWPAIQKRGPRSA